jgi:hypothetical protein
VVAELEIGNVARLIAIYVIIPKYIRLVATATGLFWK